MKVKRTIVSMAFAACCAMSLALTAFAVSDKGTVINNQVTLIGNVSGFRWPGLLIDQIFYNASISGANVDTLPSENDGGSDDGKVYVQPGYDDHLFKKIYLWRDQKGVNETGKGCAPDITEVKLYMWNQGEADILHSYLNS